MQKTVDKNYCARNPNPSCFIQLRTAIIYLMNNTH